MTGIRERLIALLLLAALPQAAGSETLRVATYDVNLTRKGAGVLLHDLGREPDAGLAAVLAVIRAARPDVLLLTSFDHDLRGRALAAFLDLLRQGPEGIDYAHVFDGPVNAGEVSGLDLDGDGMLMGWGDGWGWGKFPGNGGMALVSRLPLDAEAARSFRMLRWADLPGAELPTTPEGTPWPDAGAQAAFRLSSRSHWDVPVILPDGGRLHLLASNPTPPLFDGPEMANRLRHRDELRFWALYLDGEDFADDQGRVAPAAAAPVVVLGNLNADPEDGAGLDGAIGQLLSHPRLRDPRPRSEGAVAAAAAQGGANLRQKGAPATDTADWRDDGGPGNLRVDYVLPDAALTIAGAGVFWPAPEAALAGTVAAGPSHRLVWADVVLPEAEPATSAAKTASAELGR